MNTLISLVISLGLVACVFVFLLGIFADEIVKVIREIKRKY